MQQTRAGGTIPVSEWSEWSGTGVMSEFQEVGPLTTRHTTRHQEEEQSMFSQPMETN